MLVLKAEKGGMQGLRAEVADDDAKAIDKGIDDTVAPFRDTVVHSQGGIQLLSAVRDGVRSMAYAYALKGASASDALAKAYQGIIGEKYAISGSMRVPKSAAPIGNVQAAARQTLDELRPDQLATPPAREGFPNETDAARREAMLTAAQRGKWITNADGTGIVLLAQLRNGQTMPVLRADGTPIELRFNALPAIRPPPLSVPDTMGTNPDTGVPASPTRPPAPPPPPPDYVSAPNAGGIASRPRSSFLGPGGGTSNLTNDPVGSTLRRHP